MQDARGQAAGPAVADAIHQVGQFKFDASENEDKQPTKLDASHESFAKFLKETVQDETVSAGIPPAIPWDELAAKKKWTTAQLQESPSRQGQVERTEGAISPNGAERIHLDWSGSMKFIIKPTTPEREIDQRFNALEGRTEEETQLVEESTTKKSLP